MSETTDIGEKEMVAWLEERLHEHHASLMAYSRLGQEQNYNTELQYESEQMAMIQAILSRLQKRGKFVPCVCPDFDREEGCVDPGRECNRLEPF